MKPNIDLTENSIFREPLNIKISVLKQFSPFPWTPSKPNIVQNQLIVMGSKLDRQEYQEISIAVNPQCCDCCGRIISKYPWINSDNSLCDECLSRFQDNPIPWRDKNH